MDDPNTSQSSSSAASSSKGKECAAFGCSNTFNGPDVLRTRFHFFKFPKGTSRTANKKVHAASCSICFGNDRLYNLRNKTQLFYFRTSNCCFNNVCSLLPPQGFGLEAKSRVGILAFRAFIYKLLTIL